MRFGVNDECVVEFTNVAIAFDDAGVAEQDTSRLRVELDTDDGVTKYEVDFHVSQMEYEYDIDPVTGAILERSAEIDD